MTSSSYDFDYTPNFKVDLLPKSFNRSYFYNQSSMEDFLSSYQLVYSYQSDHNQSMQIDDSTTNIYSLLSNTTENCKEGNTTNDVQQSSPDGLTLGVGLYIGGYATLIAACIGSALNTAGIYFLLRRKGYKNMFNILLTINLIFDTIFLAFQIPRSMYTYFVSNNPTLVYYTMTNSGQRFSQIASVLMLVAFAHSQYQAVTKPYKVREFHLSSSRRRKQLLKYLIPTIFFATSFTIPVIYEIDTVTFNFCNEPVNVVVPSGMRLNPYYSMLFLGSLNLVFLGLFPFLSLLYFSYYIKKSLNQRLVFMDSRPHNESLQRRNLMNNKVIKWKAPDHEGIRNERYCNTNKATKTFFVMVFTFIILHSLRFVTSLGEFIVILGKNKISNDNLKYDGGPEWLNILAMIGSICMVINASINFLIYLYLNPTKRYNFIHLCIPLISNIAIHPINAIKSSLSSYSLQQKPSEEVTLQDEGTNRIVSVAVVEVHAADDSNSTGKVLNQNETFEVIKAGTEWL